MARADIYAKLKQDHDKQRTMLKELGEMDGASAKRKALFEKLRIELQAHAAAEEESLYATMLGEPELRDDARHSVSEHKEIDDTLGEMMELAMGEDEWEEKFFHLRRRYEHHIDEEEEEMFPKAAQDLSPEAEDRIAQVFEKRKPRELQRAAHEMPGDARE